MKRMIGVTLLALMLLSACQAGGSGSSGQDLLQAEQWTDYSHDGITYHINSRCTGDALNYYWDEEKAASYMVTVFPNVSEEESLDYMLQILDSAKREGHLDSFGFEYTDVDWAELTVDSGAVYAYNTMSIFHTDGTSIYVSTVVDGDLAVQVLASDTGGQGRDYVKAELDHILKSLTIHDEAHIPAPTPAPDSTPQPAPENMQTVGTEESGYVNIPDEWVLFQDLDGATALQYSDPLGQAILSLDTFSDEGLTEEQKAQVTAETAAYSVWYNLEQRDVTDITGARVKVGGYDSFQVYGKFTSEDHGLPSIIVCWIFEDENKMLHYISTEAPEESAIQVAGYVTDSYTLEPVAAD